MKRILVFVVDGCTPRVLRSQMEGGGLPTLAHLSARGTLALDCVSVFPSITPAATASIVTGRYPHAHGIAGMSWWEPEAGRVSYYGDDVRTVLRRGLGTFMRDFLLRLNGDRLKSATVFQTAERHDRSAGCINHLIFRGDVPHRVHIPLLLSFWPGVPGELQVDGPSLLCLGDFVSESPRPRDLSVDEGGVFNRFGMDDEGTQQFLLDVDRATHLPDVTVAYFADYDFDSHDRGPEGAADTLRRLDARLASIFDRWGGVDCVLDEACVILTADHAHSDVGAGDEARILLDDILSGHRLASPGAGWRDEDLMACPNMRAAEIYLRPGVRLSPQDVCSPLLQDPRLDQAIWCEPDGDQSVYRVSTRDRGELRFRAGGIGGRAEHVRDSHGGRWTLAGDLPALDAGVAGSGELTYGCYPDALERIAGGLEYQPARRIVVTARPGHEFFMGGQTVHAGAGSHGTLHEQDSLVPLLVAGAPAGISTPEFPRIVDVEPLCRAILGIPGGPPPGASHFDGDGG